MRQDIFVVIRCHRTVFLALLLLLVFAGLAPPLSAQTLDHVDRVEEEAALEESARVEVELERALVAIRARRESVERQIAERSRDAEARPTPAVADAPRIVNGVLTWAYPATGALIRGAVPESSRSHCTGTLVGCRTFLTANHCVEGDRDASRYRVYFQNAGIVEVEAISEVHPEYDFPHADLAVLRLAEFPGGVTPVPINRSIVVGPGSEGAIVGFGRSGGLNDDYGLKRRGIVRTAACDRTESSLLCWDFDAPVGLPGEDSNTCNADSGGPLFIGDPGEQLVAGVTAGGTLSNCLEGDHSYDVDVRQFSDWIAALAGDDLNRTECPGLPSVGDSGVQVFGASQSLAAQQHVDYRLPLGDGIERLRVAVNGEDSGQTNVDLLVRRGDIATPEANDCHQAGSSNYAFCDFEAPAAGEWFIRIAQQGLSAGVYQVVVTLIDTPHHD